jgi:hypothetical protein
LHHAGKVSADEAARIAHDEFEKYRMDRSKKMVSDFDKAVKELEKMKTTLAKNVESAEGEE